MTFRFTAAANLEVKTALMYYESRQKGLGVKFLAEMDAAISRVITMPYAWRPLSQRTRRCLFHKFPFGIIYQIRKDEILIVAVTSLKRDPELWQQLL